MRRTVGAALAAVLLTGCGAILRGPMLDVISPEVAFAVVGARLDYDDPAAWAARPDTVDAADVVPPGEADGQATATVDTFFIHPTTYAGAKTWNEPLGDPDAARALMEDVLPAQASAFNGATRVWAPLYRTATLYAFLDPTDGVRALDLAYADVERAFGWFVDHLPADHRFVIAGHSQGSFHGVRLLKEHVSGTPLAGRLVAAWLIGWNIRAADLAAMPDIPVCATPEQTGCLVSWNTEGERPAGQVIDLTSADTVCVNPLSWRADTTATPRLVGRGAWKPGGPVLPSQVDAQCHQGALVVSKPGFHQSVFADAFTGTQVWHSFDYPLFYMDLRWNVRARVGG